MIGGNSVFRTFDSSETPITTSMEVRNPKYLLFIKYEKAETYFKI